MKTQSAKSSFLPLLIIGIAVVLFSTAGFARMMGWGPVSTSDPGDITALAQAVPVLAPIEARARPRCPECGVIVSMREIEGHDEDAAPGATGAATAGYRYEFIVRMADGSSRVIVGASAASWRTGERLMIIGGVKALSH
jgi:hypothetical protein